MVYTVEFTPVLKSPVTDAPALVAPYRIPHAARPPMTPPLFSPIQDAPCIGDVSEGHGQVQHSKVLSRLEVPRLLHQEVLVTSVENAWGRMASAVQELVTL